MRSIRDLVNQHRSAGDLRIDKLNSSDPIMVKRFDMDRSFQRPFSRTPHQVERRGKEAAAVYADTEVCIVSPTFVALPSMAVGPIQVKKGDLIVVEGKIVSKLANPGQGAYRIEPQSGRTAEVDAAGLFSPAAKQVSLITSSKSDEYYVSARFRCTVSGSFAIDTLFQVDNGNQLCFESGRLDLYVLQQE
jgi:hypothetical protein